MLVDVSHHCRHDCLSLWVLTNQLHDLGVLHGVHVDLDVRLVVLTNKCLQRFAGDGVLVLLDWVCWMLIVLGGDEFAGVLNTQYLNHLAVQQRQVVQLRRRLSQLQDSLVLDDLLRHSGCVGIGDWDYIHHLIVALLGFAVAFFRLELILCRGRLSNDLFEQFKLLFHAEVHTALDSAHYLQCTLQQRKSCTDRSLSAHVRDVHITT